MVSWKYNVALVVILIATGILMIKYGGEAFTAGMHRGSADRATMAERVRVDAEAKEAERAASRNAAK